MKKFNFILSLLLVGMSLITVCLADGSKSDEKVKKVSVDIAYFNSIKFNGVGTIILTKGDKEALTIEADENIIPLLLTEVKDNTLTISDKGNIKPTKLIFHLTYKDIKTIELNGSGEIKSSTVVSSENLTIASNGSGMVDFSKLNTELLHVYNNGSGNIYLKGNGGNALYGISGSGKLTADSLQCTKIIIKMDGSGECKLYAVEALKIALAGSGQILYRGEPAKFVKDITGNGTVSKIRYESDDKK